MKFINKNTLLIGKIKINAVELGWLLSDPKYIQEMEWPDMQSFPLHENEATIPITHWEHIHDFFEWKNNLPKSDVTAFEFLGQVSRVKQCQTLAGEPSWPARGQRRCP